MNHGRGDDERIREPDLDAAWRAVSAEEPALEVDAKILAAARAEARVAAANARPPRRTPWWMRWQPLAAAAGVAGLAFLVAQRLPTGPKTEDSALESAPAMIRTPAANEAATIAGEPVSPPPAAVPDAAPGIAADRAEEAGARREAQPLRDNAAAAEMGRAAGVASLPAAGRSGEAAAGMVAPASPEARLDADAWVQRIVRLYEAGELTAAEAELRALRQTHPGADIRLPAQLRDWAASVGPSQEP